jgi:hypothetical protein
VAILSGTHNIKNCTLIKEGARRYPLLYREPACNPKGRNMRGLQDIILNFLKFLEPLPLPGRGEALRKINMQKHTNCQSTIGAR